MKKGFTLVELIAVIVVLAIILSIAIPTVSNLIKPATKRAFQNDAALVLNAVNLRRMQSNDIDVATINANNIDDVLGISNENYKTLSLELINPNLGVQSVAIRIEGQGKWDGLYACGTYFDIRVTSNYIECAGDIEPPIITLLGDNPITINIGEIYTEPGYVAIDNIDGEITSEVAIEGIINNNVPGTYTLTYSVTDQSDNTGYAIRDIIVFDNVNPIINITMNGNDVYAKSRSTIISVIDDSPLNERSLKYVWTTNVNQPDILEFINSYTNNQTLDTPSGVTGDYYLWALAIDNNSNETYFGSNVFKLDNTPPVITMNGDNIVAINRNSTYIDEGATATDNIDGEVAVIISGTVNPSLIGEYTVTYTAIDSSGNEAIPVIRTVVVRDVTAPEITILGDNPYNLILGSTYTDSGATAIDDVDGDVTNKIQMTSNVNVNIAGTYSVTYTVSDNQNNTATRTRTVNVQGITQYRYRTSSTTQSCQTCYQACYYSSATPSYWCSSGTLSGTSCVSSYGVSSTFYWSFWCNNGSWANSGGSCSGNCSSPCAPGYSGPSGYETGSNCPSGACSSGASTSCTSNWVGTCSMVTSANVSYSCPGGTFLSGTSCYYSCNPYQCSCVPVTTWSDWSLWQTTPVTPDATTEVQTRTCTNYPCQTT